MGANTIASGTAGGTAQTTGGQSSSQPVSALVPFIRASQEHKESAIDITRAMSASDQDLGTIPIPAYGYLRSLLILVEASGSTTSGQTVTADAPFSAIKSISLSEPNGAVIAQFNSGYDLAMVNKYGGYRYCQDPRMYQAYVNAGAATLNFAFILRVPLEINLRDALGSLPNQNSAAQFILRMTLSATTAVATGGTVTTPPNVRIRVFNEEWDQPEVTGEAGANQTTPPAMNTTQYWSVQQFPVVAGNVNIRLTRMGNYIRNLIFMYRDVSNNRILQTSANWPDPATIYWDTRPQDLMPAKIWLAQIYERYGYTTVAPGGGAIAFDTAGGPDTGIVAYDFAHELTGQVGRENRDLWLPTLGSTRFEIGGQWGLAGTLYVLTNDVSVAGDVFL